MCPRVCVCIRPLLMWLCVSLCVLTIYTCSSKNLTWRDMQHLVVRSSHPAHLLTNDWRTNGVGRKGTASPPKFSSALCSFQTLLRLRDARPLELNRAVVWNLKMGYTLFSWSVMLELGEWGCCSHQTDIHCVCSLLVSAVSHSYGYGLLDASAIVELAKTWTSVGPQRKCVITMVSEPRFVQYTHTHTHDPNYMCLHILQLSLKENG